MGLFTDGFKLLKKASEPLYKKMMKQAGCYQKLDYSL